MSLTVCAYDDTPNSSDKAWNELSDLTRFNLMYNPTTGLFEAIYGTSYSRGDFGQSLSTEERWQRALLSFGDTLLTAVAGYAVGKATYSAAKFGSQALKKHSISKITTGRTQASNIAGHGIQEQMTMNAAKNGAGRQIMSAKPMADPRYAGQGYQKWEYTTRAASGNKTSVHYMKDSKTNFTWDFKFKN